MESLLLTLTWLLGLSCSVLGLIAALGFRARRSWKVIWGIPVLVALAAPLCAALPCAWLAYEIHRAGAEPCRLWFFGSWLGADLVHAPATRAFRPRR